MSTTMQTDAGIDFRLSTNAKEVIEEAAALSGQSVSDFAVSTLLEKANSILESNRVRVLSERDARIFLSVLDSTDGPNDALREAGRRHRERHANRTTV